MTMFRFEWHHSFASGRWVVAAESEEEAQAAVYAKVMGIGPGREVYVQIDTEYDRGEVSITLIGVVGVSEVTNDG